MNAWAVRSSTQFCIDATVVSACSAMSDTLASNGPLPVSPANDCAVTSIENNINSIDCSSCQVNLNTNG